MLNDERKNNVARNFKPIKISLKKKQHEILLITRLKKNSG